VQVTEFETSEVCKIGSGEWLASSRRLMLRIWRIWWLKDASEWGWDDCGICSL